MSVDGSLAQWLMAEARYVTSAPAGASAWGDSARETTIVSPLALEADAEVEAARQAGFLAGPFAVDEHDVLRSQTDCLGRVITIKGDRMGYQNGKDVFVIGVQEGAGITTLTVLVRLS